MRGIAGIVSFGPGEPICLEPALRAMDFGGMDRVSSAESPQAAFGHVLRGWVVEDSFERQPLNSADSHYTLVTDAILTGRNDLARKLGTSADTLATTPDSALMLAAWEKWGPACVGHLEGRFAMAVWDARERRLFLAVDRLGTRPLYFWQRGDRFAFASTLRALLALPGVDPALDEETFVEHIAGIRRVSPRTLYRDISRVNGGHTMMVDRGGVRAARYWTPSADRVLRLGSDAEYLDAFRAELDRAVGTALERMPGRAGIFLSGGLDSSAVSAVAGGILAGRGERLQAFHSTPLEPGRYRRDFRQLDESSFVSQIRDHAPHIDFHIVGQTSRPLPLAQWHEYFEDHCVPPATFPEEEDVEREALLDSLGIGGMLNGLAGNFLVSLEAYATGYLAHLAASGQWLRWARELRGNARFYGRPLRQLVRRTLLNPARRSLRGWPLDNDAVQRLALLNPALRKRTGIDERLREFKRGWAQSPRDFRLRLHRVLTEMMAQQVGVTPAVLNRRPIRRLSAGPLFDPRLNEFCLALPFDQQIRNGCDRRLLRESMRGLLPDPVRLRVTRGFPQPALQRFLRGMEDELRTEARRLANRPAVNEWLDGGQIKRLWDEAGDSSRFTDDIARLQGVMTSRFLEWRTT